MTVQPLIDLARSRRGLGPDDVIACLAPLFRQVIAVHAEGLVAPLHGIGELRQDDRYRVSFEPGAARPASHPGADAPEYFELAHGWQTWEHEYGYQDELTDLASLGLLLAALACGLDLAVDADAETLARHRGNLFAIKPDLHPVIAQLIEQMIEPDRHARLQDLPSALQRLLTYRDQPLDFSLDVLDGLTDEPATAGPQYRRIVLETLRDRLFDLSRRNRLLYFRSTLQSLNLTEASIPLLLDVRNIEAEQVCTWNSSLAERVLHGQGLSVGSVIRPDDAPYAAGVLDGLIAQARRDRSEYGQSQLRLIVAFLHWTDLKNAADERISSPLLLLPAELTKRRGVRDSYRLLATDRVAEVNPALRQQLERLYGIDLPETVDLTDDAAIAALHTRLAGQIAAGEPGVQLTIRDQPRIDVLYQRARLRHDTYQRRTGQARAVIAGHSYSYSYRRNDRRPLGVQIFRNQVAEPTAAVLAPAVSVPTEALAAPSGTSAPTSNTDANPYAWEIDLCSVTLANLNYRTMSLVRDYRDLISGSDREHSSVAFDRVFSREPRPVDPIDRPTLPLADRHLVVPADGSQVAAVALARQGQSFVIQGPPGTGKSQTITNLIADYVARGQRVLFVCQKRAAIDVVHARLQAQGLDELTCLIHDSQTDKKQFVLGLKRSYENWLATGDDVSSAEVLRTQAVSVLESALDEVQQYEAVLAGSPGGTGPGPSLRTLVERLIELAGQRWGDELTPAQQQLLPGPAAWWAARPAVDAVAAALMAADRSPILGDSPLRFLAAEVLNTARPEVEVRRRAAAAADAVRNLVKQLDVGPGDGLDLQSVARVIDRARVLAPLARRERLDVLRASSAVAEEMTRDVAGWQRNRAARDQAATAASGWVAPPAPDEARAALEVARRREGSFWRGVHGDWRRVRGLVAAGYGGPAGGSPSQLLGALVAAHQAEAALEDSRAEFERTWGHPDPTGLVNLVEQLRADRDPGVVRWREALLATDSSTRARSVEQLAEARSLVDEVRAGLDGLLVDVDELPLIRSVESEGQAHGEGLAIEPGPSMIAVLDSLTEPGVTAPGPTRALPALHEHPLALAALRRLPASPDQVEYAVCAATLAEATDADLGFARFDGHHLADLIDRIQRVLPELLNAEAELLVSRVRSRFLAEAVHAEKSVTGLSTADRHRKQVWTAGRRVLEHEFGKVQRYRSIRELSSGDSGVVVAALRPVWLMSPTSVSDTLPLDPGLFDVVIYDEASQIPVEEAVPAMHRGDQVIVVGDRMQLPPTQYFSTGSELSTGLSADSGDSARNEPSAGDDSGASDRDEDEIPVVLDGDSFLAQSAVRLPSTMLSWHYRSRFEALIAFSNTMFYEGRLAVVPDRAPAVPGRPEIVVDVGDPALPQVTREDAVLGVDALLGRSISLHRTPGSVYRRRANPGEAVYVAELVREFLRRRTGQTLGIVAFSQAQQGEIERALERLASTDDLFAQAYEDELVRKDGEQAVGLFVKNLENVQGDERDVMIMSICYAPGENGRMLMNFGPINQKGGEKRLNVIVSRARQHLAVVSSIEAEAITNTYNDGANTLRRFLAYARTVSGGDPAAAVAALGRVTAAARAVGAGPVSAEPVGTGSVGGVGAGVIGPGAAMAAALRRRGLIVTEGLGQSAFRCDLAIRRPNDADYRVAVLLDTASRVAAQPLGERLTSNPAVLTSAGWRVAHVLLRDWYDDPEGVIDGLLQQVID